eukprot:173402-Rhodomonas_salina.1
MPCEYQAARPIRIAPYALLVLDIAQRTRRQIPSCSGAYLCQPLSAECLAAAYAISVPKSHSKRTAKRSSHSLYPRRLLPLISFTCTRCLGSHDVSAGSIRCVSTRHRIAGA